jgi:hypothetical protein
VKRPVWEDAEGNKITWVDCVQKRQTYGRWMGTGNTPDSTAAGILDYYNRHKIKYGNWLDYLWETKRQGYKPGFSQVECVVLCLVSELDEPLEPEENEFGLVTP